jgi:hypothetical protein
MNCVVLLLLYLVQPYQFTVGLDYLMVPFLKLAIEGTICVLTTT